MITPQKRIEQAFYHLHFTIKLFDFFRRGRVIKADFDRAVSIPTPQGNLDIAPGLFITDHDLVLAAENTYSSALGVCAIAMETALVEAGIRNDPTNQTASGQLRTIVFQIRNAFAHDAMFPRWSAKGQYQRSYDLRQCGVTQLIDLRALDGRHLELDQLGGMKGFENIRDAVVKWVTTGHP